MSTPFYPVALRLAARRCLVVGGGRVAERKVEGLLEAGARVRVVSPRLTLRLEALAEEGRIECALRPFEDGDVTGAFLVFAATDDAALNSRIVRLARSRGSLAHSATAPAEGDFINPAVARRGPVTVAVTTGASSPALAAEIAGRLLSEVGEEDALAARLTEAVRYELKRRGAPQEERMRAALEASSSATRALLREGRLDEIATALARACSLEEAEAAQLVRRAAAPAKA